MKYLPFKILILCVFLPPVLYLFSVQSIERYLHGKYLSEIENTYVGDTAPLFNGSIGLNEAVAKNITRYFQTKKLLAWGVKARLAVSTKRGKIIYPPVFEEENPLPQSYPMKIAAENYTLMTEGLLLDLNLTLAHNTVLSNVLLIFYIMISVVILNRYYRAGLNKTRKEEQEKEKEINRLLHLEKKHLNSLAELAKDKDGLTSEHALIKNQYEDVMKRASRNEDEMIEEIMALEEQLNQNLARQKKRQDEIDILTEKLSRYEKEKPKLKAPEALQKRFKAIYKNISIQERALGGFIDLTDNLKIKAEEIIHQLNQDPALVPIKRKVFGKKGRETVLEVVFAYKGRLYFRKLQDNRIDILAVGTKNVQAKDLQFLDKL
jgi:hypothetical protein